jgi:hypothetical protein
MRERLMMKRIEEEKRLLEKLMTWLPGFKGYKEKELRRESDRLLRTHLYQKMRNIRTILYDLYREVVDLGLVEIWESIDRIIIKVDTVSERINHAAYGYTGFFDALKVDEIKLDNMIAFDHQLLEKIENLSKKIGEVKDQISKKDIDELAKHVNTTYSLLLELEMLLNERKSTILGIIGE